MLGIACSKGDDRWRLEKQGCAGHPFQTGVFKAVSPTLGSMAEVKV